MKTGIYKILNIETGDFYIGSACHFYNRKSKHLQLLRKNTHNNRHLQNAFNKYGEDRFKFFLLEECLKGELPIKEQYYIDNMKPKYNICTLVEGRWGIPQRDEVKEKIRQSVKKYHQEKGHSEEVKQKIAETLRGRKQSSETIEKRRQANKKAWELKLQK